MKILLMPSDLSGTCEEAPAFLLVGCLQIVRQVPTFGRLSRVVRVAFEKDPLA